MSPCSPHFAVEEPSSASLLAALSVVSQSLLTVVSQSLLTVVPQSSLAFH